MDANPRLLALTRALADPLRLAVLHRLMTGPATVSELMAVVGAEQSRLSNHLALLRERRLVRTTRQGRHVIYELHDAAVGTLVEALGQIGGAAPRAGVVSGERSESPSSDRQCSSPRTICALWWRIFSTSSAGRIDSCR